MQTTDAAAAFRALHETGTVLVLANAWDAASARLFEDAGARAVATTSAGIAWSCGYPDGNALPREALRAAVAAIRRVTSVPLTVDFESGFSTQPSEVAERVGDLLELGVAGINLEDGDASPELLAQKIAAVKASARTRGTDIFVNARTDVFLRDIVSPEDAVRETIARAARYREAGADGIFVPAVVEPDAIRTIAASIALPLNVMAVPGLPDAAALYALGARRLSAGSALAQLAFGTARRAAASFLASGDTAVLSAGDSLDYGATNARF